MQCKQSAYHSEVPVLETSSLHSRVPIAAARAGTEVSYGMEPSGSRNANQQKGVPAATTQHVATRMAPKKDDSMRRVGLDRRQIRVGTQSRECDVAAHAPAVSAVGSSMPLGQGRLWKNEDVQSNGSASSSVQHTAVLETHRTNVNASESRHNHGQVFQVPADTQHSQVPRVGTAPCARLLHVAAQTRTPTEAGPSLRRLAHGTKPVLAQPPPMRSWEEKAQGRTAQSTRHHENVTTSVQSDSLRSLALSTNSSLVQPPPVQTWKQKMQNPRFG